MYRRILVRATNWVGDAVMSVPALQALRAGYPDAHIAILARPWVGALYAREPFCDELISYEVPPGWAGFGEKWRLARELRARQFDCAVLFPNAFGAAALMRLAGIPVIVGYRRDFRAWLMTHAVRRPRRGELPAHQRFYYLELLKRAGLIASYNEDRAIRLSGAAPAAKAGRNRLDGQCLRGAVIGVSPGAAYGGAKRWLPERFAEAAVSVAREREASVAVFGSKEEASMCESVRERVSGAGVRCMNFAGATSLAEFIEMAAACELFLTNDSGPMHIASALGVPTIAVFGATDESATGP
ncbi:MAG: lipopolysaccharide heptosyltransferase II, partial [Acidobacteriaceae bacterium]|nr:lipopolysaccharide heptosyltransferase II [Acidobacteriaceae bacterium]